MEVVGLILSLVSLAGIIGSVGFGLRHGHQAGSVAHVVRELRHRHRLDRRTWAVVRRAVHRGVAAPGPLRPIGHAYAAGLLRSTDLGVLTPSALAGYAFLLLGQVSLLMFGAHGVGRVLILTSVTIFVGLLLWAVPTRARRAARARAALAASEQPARA